VLNIISNPVNSTVPIAAESLKKMGVYDARKVMGVTTLDVVSGRGWVGGGAGGGGRGTPSWDPLRAAAAAGCGGSGPALPPAAPPQAPPPPVPHRLPTPQTAPLPLKVRAKTFYAEKLGVDVASVDIPVVGGHAGITILPLFSQATPGHSLKAEDIDALTKRTQDGGTEVVLAKAGKGSATLSMAYAAALFADACLRGLNGQVATECAFVESSVEPGVPFFASRVKLSTEGAQRRAAAAGAGSFRGSRGSRGPVG
jgi:hypothetical protein